MARYTHTPIGTGYNSEADINRELSAIESAINETLSKEGDVPNSMNANLDMNGFGILNGNADITELTSFATIELVNQIVAGTVSQFLVPIINVSASFTPALSENNSTWIANSASAVTMTIPPASSEAFPIGSLLTMSTIGTGACSFVAGAGVTLRSESGALILTQQYAVGSALLISADTWLVTGSLTT